MRKLLITALLTIAATTGAFSQKKTESTDKTNSEAQKLVQFMTDWANLSNKHDIAALDKFLPADLVLTFQDGQVQTKDEYIAALRQNTGDFTITDYDQKVALYDCAAIVRARYVVAVGTDTIIEFRYTTTFLKRKGRWEPVAFHSSPLAKR